MTSSRPMEENKTYHSSGHGSYIAPPPGKFSVGAGEKLDLSFLVLPGESRDIDITVDLEGEGAELSVRGIYLLNADERVRVRLLVHHKAPHCISRQIFNGVAAGNSDFSFEGTVVVAPGADGTDAAQTNHNILLSDSAKADTKPALEIYADDVKCSHGATVGKLDESARFYMRSRGIPEAEAVRFQILSFLSPVTIGLSPEDTEKVESAVTALVG